MNLHSVMAALSLKVGPEDSRISRLPILATKEIVRIFLYALFADKAHCYLILLDPGGE